MPTDEWQDCKRVLPYRDYQGRLRIPNHTQRRKEGDVWQYRERPETEDEYDARQW